MEPQTIDPFDKNLQLIRSANETSVSISSWFSEKSAKANASNSTPNSEPPRQIVPSYTQSSMLSMLPEERPRLIFRNLTSEAGGGGGGGGTGLPAGAIAKEFVVCENGQPTDYWFLVWESEPEI
jgi:hypothetical protein